MERLSRIEATYRDDRDPIIPRVKGVVSSSHGLYLRPDTLYAMAHPSGWAVEADDIDASPEQAKNLLDAEGLLAKSPCHDEDGLLLAVSVSARDYPEILNPDRRKAVLALLGGTITQQGSQAATRAVRDLFAATAASAKAQDEMDKIVEELLCG